MNSYPAELLVQLAPVMFVAGLPNAPSEVDEGGPAGEGLGQDQFSALAQRLRDVLGSQGKPAIWASEAMRKGKQFQVVFVDKTVQFPPRKIPDPASPPAVHSPLSPLHPSSPLYPDGLIAPIWIRKHTTLVPSVFVLFMRMFEHTTPPPMPRSPLEPEGVDVQKAKEDREKEERRWDAELARQISERKKNTNERGMKLTVVLMASRKMLDEPSLDSRLTSIRRSSGLDSRAALFVLSPVSPSELTDFVKSLQQALYEPAIEYYTAHSKRVRRKRNRHTQTTSSSAYPHGLANNARPLPLRPEGWTVRYEYKMACFAEFRGEMEVALKHYQDAHTALLTMFGSHAILQPRTKRWAEAKVLADTLNLKICKLFLYNAEHSLALSQHNSHIRRFCDLSTRVWGIGEDTFEYWSWLARQYRVFAELLEQGAHFSLAIPEHLPSPPTSTSTQATQDIDSLQALGINPSTAIMHPGFYYYAAAECTEQRRLRFMAALDAESSQQGTSQAPGFQNEKRVDHLGTILELYTKAYELFKKHGALPSPSQSQLSGRFTLWIAYKIAQTYHTSGKYDMAIRFCERISRTYSREKWEPILHPMLSTWYTCAQRLGDVDMSVRLLTEMIARGVVSLEGDEDDLLAEDFHAVLKSTVPTSSDSLIVDLTDTDPPFDCSVLFWTNEAELDERILFQISIHVPTNIDFSKLPLDALRLFLSDGTGPIVVKCISSEEEKDTLLTRLEHISVSADGVEVKEVEARFRWRPGDNLILSGTISSSVPREIKFAKAEICLAEGSWKIIIPFDMTKRRDASVRSATWLVSDSPIQSIPIRRSNASSVIVKNRPHQVYASFSHSVPAYLDETYPISIDVTNQDDRELEITLDILLQPGEDDQANHILLDDEHSSSLIKGISFGVLAPGVTGCKILKLTSTGSAGERMVDLSIQSRISRVDGSDEDIRPADATEILQTLVIPVVPVFSVSTQTTYMRRTTPASGPADLTNFGPDYWDDSLSGNALISTVLNCTDCIGASTIIIKNIRLVPEEDPHSQVIHDSLNSGDFPLELLPGDQFGINSALSLAPPEDYYVDNDAILPSPGYFVVQWSKISAAGNSGEFATTRIALPTLKPPIDSLVAMLHVPPLVHLHQPFTVELVISNRHPTRTACPSVTIEPDSTPSSSSQPSSDGFVIAGMRAGRLPVLIPGAETRVSWRLIPLECGIAVRLPKIRVRDLRAIVSAPQREREQVQAQPAEGQHDGDVGSIGAGPVPDVGDEIPIIDARWDKRKESLGDAPPMPQVSTMTSEEDVKARGGKFTVVVSPA